MRKLIMTLLTGLFVLALAGSGAALNIELYVDSAPNAYGSPDWPAWWTDTKTDIVGDSFTNLRTGTYPGTLSIDPYDEIVYSTGDLGKRLHWIYYVPGATVASLDGLFEVKWVIDWGGEDLTQVGTSWALDGAEVGWVQPSSWEDYDGGVIGSFGFAWWAGDGEAPPPDSNGNPWDETDQADIDALRELVLAYQTHATGLVRYRASESDPWTYTEIRVSIPDASTFILLGSATLLGGLMSRRRRTKA